MKQYLKTNCGSGKRVLQIAHCFDADYSMESRLSWFRAVQSAEFYDTTVVCAAAPAECLDELPLEVRRNLSVITVPHSRLESSLLESPVFFYLAYRLWHRRVFKLLEETHSETPYDLVHQVSYCGYREPGEGWRLGAKFLWGPIGGTQNVPWRFLSELSLLGATKEVCRAVVNSFQIHFGMRVGRALRAATTVLAANSQGQKSLFKARGAKTMLQLETGLEKIEVDVPEQRDVDEPLKILWAGRLEPWKGLSLLIKALAEAPKGFRYQLRVLGSGSYSKRWHKLAERLGVEHIEWVDLPNYDQRDEHYRWADVFVFTSLRDTSGTGLLESLAAGVPIVGLDHQGARDIMTKDCAVAVAVESPHQVAVGICAALLELAKNPAELRRLSIGALGRARHYHWDRLGEEMLELYRVALDEKTGVAGLGNHALLGVEKEESPSAVMS